MFVKMEIDFMVFALRNIMLLIFYTFLHILRAISGCKSSIIVLIYMKNMENNVINIHIYIY